MGGTFPIGPTRSGAQSIRLQLIKKFRVRGKSAQGSLEPIEIAKLAYGTIVDDRRVRRGIIGFRNEELVL